MTPEVKERVYQLRHGIVPEGYRRTKAGIVPADWSEYAIADCLERVERPVEVKADEMYTQIGIRSHGKGLFYKEPVRGEELGNKAVFWIEPDCFVLNIVFAWEQAIGKTTQAEVGMIGSHRFPMYRPVDGKIDIDYLISYLMTKRGKDILEVASPGGAGRNRTLGQDRFMKSEIVLPTPKEQKKIATILTTQDKVIELKEKLLVEKQRQKKYLMQQLITGKKRLPGFDGEWIFVRANTIFKNVTDKKHDGRLEVLSATQDRGIIPRSQVDIDIKYAEESLSGYKKVIKGNFVISLRSFQGGVEYSEYTGIVSPAYTVLSSTYPIEDNYYKQYFKSTDYINRLNVAVYGIRDGKQISYDDFGRIKIPYPPLGEQRAIATVLSTADREIELLSKDIKQEKKKKKALMQL
ncbi:MAG: restriction endonuclease subunit S, partial [Lachnospiraceae bacterium]|nr:restriction endonuclease subunit S [Lachnospiraceae bacterium]